MPMFHSHLPYGKRVLVLEPPGMPWTLVGEAGPKKSSTIRAKTVRINSVTRTERCNCPVSFNGSSKDERKLDVCRQALVPLR